MGQADDERRQQVRVPVQLAVSRARRWVGGAWRDIDATVVDLSSRGVGLRIAGPGASTADGFVNEALER